MKQRLIHVFFHWLPLGAAIVLVGGLSYGAAQQVYRQSLNDPQVQLVEDAQAALLAGKQPAEVMPVGTTGVIGPSGARGEVFDAEKSLAPFVVVFDPAGNALESNASVGGVPPKPPVGVFEETKQRGEYRVSWQPNPTTRIALVIRPVGNSTGWYVAAGRNMRETEARIQSLTLRTAVVVLFTLVLTFLLDLWGDTWRRRNF